MAIRTRRSSRNQWKGNTAAAFAAGAAATLLLLWLLAKHSAALAVVPGQPGVSRGAVVEAGWGTASLSTDENALTAAESNQASTKVQPGASSGGQGDNSLAQEQQQQQQQPAPVPNLDAVPHLMLSFGNAAYFELAHNWAKSVQAIGAPYIIAAFDNEMMDRCAEVGLSCVKVEFGQAANFRGDFAAFRAMGAVKVRFALSILRDHTNLKVVVVSDTDTIWLRPPWYYFEQRQSAEFFITSDCLSHELEERWERDHGQPRCGHIPGKNDQRAFNTGLFAARNTLAAQSILQAWADMLVDPTKEKADDPMHRGIDDQLAMNHLLEAGGLKAVSEDDPRTVLAFNQSLFLQTLPVALFSNGHVAFVQRIPWKLGIAPIVIHATFQRHNIVGKKARLREFGLWHMDPPEYYGQGAGAGLRLLAYQNGVLAWVEEAERQKYGGQGRRMPLMEKNFLGMSYQLHALRDALAAARILNRTLLLPQLWCWCDNDEHPHILFRCRIKGTDYGTPFECPLDFLIAPNTLDDFHMDYRHAGFLEQPQVPATLRHSRAVVRIAESKPKEAFPAAAKTVGHAVAVWPGIQAGELQLAVQPVDSAAVLELQGQVPGFLAGWDPPDEGKAAQFDFQFEQVAFEAKWCCFTWGDADDKYRDLYYSRPAKLADPWQPWRAPQLEMPDWCDLVSEKHGNKVFTLLPQHPCTFLRNATAAEYAADNSGHVNAGSFPGT